jgi:hypothetical protein
MCDEFFKPMWFEGLMVAYIVMIVIAFLLMLKDLQYNNERDWLKLFGIHFSWLNWKSKNGRILVSSLTRWNLPEVADNIIFLEWHWHLTCLFYVWLWRLIAWWGSLIFTINFPLPLLSLLSFLLSTALMLSCIVVSMCLHHLGSEVMAIFV